MQTAGEHRILSFMTDGELVRLIAHKLRAAEDRDWYRLLDVRADASEEAIHRAYLELVRLLHPDRIARRKLGPVASQAAEVMRQVQRAFDVLSDARRRAAYDRERGIARADSEPPPSTGGPVLVAPQRTQPAPSELPPGLSPDDLLTRPVSSFSASERSEIARAMHTEGARLFARGDLAGAERHFRRAIELDPDVPDYHMKLGWLILRDQRRGPEERLQESRPHLEHAAARRPYDPSARYWFAQYWRTRGDIQNYRRELEAVLRADPTHRKAQDELAALEARDTSPSSPQGTLGVTRRPQAGRLQALREGVRRLLKRRNAGSDSG